MNDRFRFRVWNEEEKIFEEINFERTDGFFISQDGKLFEITRLDYDSSYIDERPDLIKEFCTGLKDENGKLIYEGDIVRVFYDHFDGNFTEKEVVGPVVWECGNWVVNGWFLNFAPEYDETHLESAAVEVIGNIHEHGGLLVTQTHENPELLEDK